MCVKLLIELVKQTSVELENDKISCAEVSAKVSRKRIIADFRSKENALLLAEYFVSD
ncbi:hypothetical protein [Sphingobacterium faecale]|uniref:Uncharacterized protein n=1 Tax=Sphingobacterium faecale TaxID=2803775 RepID=A0ABS1R0K3_9SPHI|nr:hypothetical protein [Sphingobacterium faecale]MBL1407572.1 hypothetical protein [Sphingobacterium faecale]